MRRIAFIVRRIDASHAATPWGEVMIPDLPGWDSLPAVTRYHSWSEMAGIVFLALLVIAEIVTFKYGHRKDDLTEQQQIATQQRHDEEMARVHLEAAQINERAARLEKEAAEANLKLARITTNRDKLLKREGIAEKMIAKLLPFKSTQYDAGLGINSGEQADFLWHLIKFVFDKAEWTQVPWRGAGLGLSFGNSGMPVSGSVAAQNVEIHVHPQSREKFQPAINALISAFKSADIEATDSPLNVNNDNPDALHILVGEIR
jgi:hypothetical protein